MLGRLRRFLPSAALIAAASLFSAPFAAAQASQVPAAPAAPQTSEPLTLEAAFARGLTSNPTIAAARLRRAIDLAGIDVAGERPNPEAHVEFEKETPKQNFGLAVPVELGGKRKARIAVAQATLQTGDAELTATILDIRNQVRQAYFGRVIAEQRLAILDELRQSAVRLTDAAQARFDVGSAPRLEALQAQLALAVTENEVGSARATVEAARVSLNALLGLPLESNAPLATGIDTAPALVGPIALTRAQAANAELAVLDRQIAEAQAKVTLAHAMRKPDVIPDFTVAHDAEPDFVWGWRAAALMSVPLFNSHRAGVRMEEATLGQLNAERAAVLARVTAQVTSASTLAEAERAAYIRYRDQILPQAEEVARMAEDSYRLGQTGIAALLQALQQSLQVRLQTLQTGSDFQNALGDLERAIGAPIP